MARPEWAMSCGDCRKYLHDDNGRKQKHKLTLQLIPRGKVPTPCGRCPKIPDDAPRKSWEFAADLTPMLSQIWNHYRQCRAIGSFRHDEREPVDPLVSLCAVLIADAEEIVADRKKLESDQRMEFMMQLLARKR